MERVLLLLWFALNLFIGARIVHEYGISLDEPNNYRFATATINAYPSFFGTLYEPKYDSSFDGHGPAFVVIVTSLSNLIENVFPRVYIPDVRHSIYFVTFQLMCLCLYWLTRRWFGRWTAWSALLLFGTQPLLVGHAFINPKDTPFMFLFTLSIVLGFRLVDTCNAEEPSASLAGPVRRLKSRFRTAEPERRRRFLMYLAIVVTILFMGTLFSSQRDSLVGPVVRYFYAAQPNSWAGQIFERLASEAANLPPDNYVAKASRLLERGIRAVVLTGMIFVSVYFLMLINHTDFRLLLKTTRNRRSTIKHALFSSITPLRKFLRFSSMRIWVREFLRIVWNPPLLLAAFALGLATAVRPIAPLAGLIVIVYLFAKKVPHTWAISLAYFLIAGVVTYVAWPYLWESPILKYLQSLGVVSNFSYFSGRVLFNGEFYGIRDLPYSYLPVLLNIQFTEPLVLAFYAGSFVMGNLLLRERLRADLILYLGLGFALPLLALILLNSPLYHNFRQALFIVPPIFMMAAFALDLLLRKAAATWIRVILILAIALPGIYSSVKLYPYQYVYYNSFVGGTRRVQDRFELDYWRTSLREAAVHLNGIAPPGAWVLISGSTSLFETYARPDLLVETVNYPTQNIDGGYDYSIQLSRWEKWNIYPNAEIEFVIERDGAVLATIRAVRNASYR